MTIDEFRKMALEIPTAVEQSHMNHPDFRVTGKIFASLGAPDANWSMVKLTPEQQRAFIEKAPEVFKPCSGLKTSGCFFDECALLLWRELHHAPVFVGYAKRRENLPVTRKSG